MAYTKYSLTPSSNTAAPPDGAPEGMLPSAVNDTMRDMMSQIRDCGDGIRGGTYTMTAPVITGGSITGATFSASSATITGGSVTGVTFSSSAATITGGSINGATVGATTPSTGAFTTASLKGSTSGAVTLAVPAVAGTNTLTLPALTGDVITSADTGTITKSMISTSTSTGMGVCRAWVTFVGSTGAVSASYNVSSVTRGSAGSYTVNFTTALPDGNFCTQVMFQATVTNAGSDSFAINPATTGVDVRHFESNIARDGNYCCVVVFR